MPLYEYQCPKCGRFELIRKFADPPVTECPTCGSPVQKLASAPAFHLKGTGWYVTDYGKGGKSPSAPSNGKSETKAETKTDTKTETKSETKSESKSESKPASTKSDK